MKLLFVSIPQIAKAFSSNSKVTFLYVLFRLWYFAITRKLKLIQNDFTLHVVYNGKDLTFYLQNVMDIAVLREVFVDLEYAWIPTVNPRIIIDLGAHFGDTALYYHARFPEATIIAVEPSPENFCRLKMHTKHIDKIVCVQAAVGSSNGKIVLNLMDSSLGHSVMNRAGTSSSVEVSQVTLPQLLSMCDVSKADLVKFDVEGAEFGLFSDEIRAENISNAYIGEIHNDLNENNLPPIETWFKKFTLSKLPINEKRYVLMAVTSNS